MSSLSVRRNAFSTGFIFEYWDSTKNGYIKPKYYNLRDELINGGHLTLEEWMEFVDLKAKQYMKSNRVSKMKACNDVDGNTGAAIGNGNPVTMQHLFALILYCDFGKICTAFSATFRRENIFEDLESVERRHAKLAIFGRLLVELVLRFGICGGSPPFGERGPFYCGINTTLNIGHYAIRLMGPCSTSTVRAVALNFAKSDGIIMTLNNDNYEAGKQRFVDCSWISNYHEESERLWIAGINALRIISIAIVDSAKNYKTIIHALYVLDSMISGVGFGTEDIQVTSDDEELISALMNMEIGTDFTASCKYDQYVMSEWQLFIGTKEEIILDLNEIFYSFKATLKLIMYSVKREGSGNDNVFKPEWLWMFPSLKTLKIRAMYRHIFTFGLDALLESIKLIPASVKVVVEDADNWTKKLFNTEVFDAYSAAGWNIEYDDEHQWKDVVGRKEKGAMMIEHVGV